MLDKYSTHLPLLIQCAENTTGPILELGIGEGSTPTLHGYAIRGRRVVSYDTDPEYFAQFADRFTSPNHEFHLIGRNDWDKAEIDCPWSVVLVDHRPAARRRHEVLRLKDLAEFIVVHDTEPEIDRFYRFRFDKFRFVYHDNQIPRTSIVSNRRNPRWL